MKTNAHVLIIEDDVVDQKAFMRFSRNEELPYDFRIAGSLAEARRLLDLEPFDIIISDNLLGDGNGIDVLDWKQDAPVIIVTGSGSENIAVEAMKKGAYDYIIKDSERRYINTLSLTIENTIMRRKTEEALRVAERELKERAAELEARNKELALLGEELRKQTIIDPLTGIFNKRHMESIFEKEVRRASRKQSPLSCIMFDIDHFKRVNDTFGHDAGDFVLKELGILLSTSIRVEDIACRFGGEEFCLILPDCFSINAYHRAKTIIGNFKNNPLICGGAHIGPVTISAGVSGYPDHGESPLALLKAADSALYRAKREGRDRVVVFFAGAGAHCRAEEEGKHD